VGGWFTQPKFCDGGALRGGARVVFALVASAALAATVASCGGSPSYEQPAAPDELSTAAQLGEQIFKDTSLSASRRQACATCHDPANAHAPANAFAAQPGGPALSEQGVRQAPGIRYLRFNSAFHFDGEGTPVGGFFWDGRAASLQAQAAEPFLNPLEMAMPSKAAVVQRLSEAAYADAFRAAFGPDIFADADAAYDRMTFALAQYQKEDGEFAAFSSKYDAFLRGRASLTTQELRGLALFNDPGKGNCAACHPSARGEDGSLPLFTDFTYDNLGVPRNPELQVNSEPTYFDLGLCARPDGSLAARTDLCGAFKVPSLRNVGLRHTFFHNGRFKTLKDALTFYVQRDTNPEKFYPTVGGVVQKFDDLPPQYHGNVNRTEPPYDRGPGDAPALTDAEIDDVIAFLHTLSEGFAP
jgi:cytochrome c peroxidase